MIDVENMCFHGVSFINWDYVVDGITNFQLLESILKDGFILSKEHLGCQNSFGIIRNIGWNSDNRVCICNHSCKDDEYSFQFNFDDAEISYRQRAFDSFVSNNYSIILDSSILNDFDYLKRGMIGEYQVYGDIPLSYMRGIGIPNHIRMMLDNVEDMLGNYDDFDFRQRLDFNVKNLADMKSLDEVRSGFFTYANYIRVLQLLEDYGYDALVVDPVAGLEWESIDVMNDRFKRVKERAFEKKLIKNR